MAKRKLQGQRFGMLTVLDEEPQIRRIGKKQVSARYWHCRCDCGNDTWVNQGPLVYGATRSCGCGRSGLKFSHTVDLRGKRFGKLTVLDEEPEKRGKTTGLYWHCRCDCGNDTWVVGSSLQYGRTVTCGKCVKPGTRPRKTTEKSEHPGAYKMSNSGKYYAKANCGGRQFHLGSYDTPEEASQIAAKFKAEVSPAMHKNRYGNYVEQVNNGYKIFADKNHTELIGEFPSIEKAKIAFGAHFAKLYVAKYSKGWKGSQPDLEIQPFDDIPKRKCLYCGKMFQSANNVPFCSDECRKKQKRISECKCRVKKGLTQPKNLQKRLAEREAARAANEK